MTVDALTAAKAYGNQMKMLQGADDASANQEANTTPFLKMLENAGESVMNTESGAEAKQLQSLTGKVELTNLTTSIAGAELTLNAVVAIRDRVINAYNDIAKMSI